MSGLHGGITITFLAWVARRRFRRLSQASLLRCWPLIPPSPVAVLTVVGSVLVLVGFDLAFRCGMEGRGGYCDAAHSWILCFYVLLMVCFSDLVR